MVVGHTVCMCAPTPVITTAAAATATSDPNLQADVWVSDLCWSLGQKGDVFELEQPSGEQ